MEIVRQPWPRGKTVDPEEAPRFTALSGLSTAAGVFPKIRRFKGEPHAAGGQANMIATGDETTGMGFAGAERSAKPTGELQPPRLHVPRAAKWLGALGAIPFVFLALAAPFLEAPFQERALFALAAYGAVILSFLGGIHWGLAMAGAGPVQGNATTFARLGASVVPSLVGWGALLLSRPIGLLVLAAAFLGLLFFDCHASRKARTPAWYPKLRWPLTVVVVASLTLAAFT